MTSFNHSALSSLVLWNPFTGFSKGFTLLSIDFVQTLAGHSSGFSVGHTEHVISLNSSVHATVPWDWFSELLHLRAGVHLVNSEKSVGSRIGVLFVSLIGLGSQESEVVSLIKSWSFLLAESVCWSLLTVESVHGSWWDWLHRTNKLKRLTKYLPSWKWCHLCWLRQSGQWSRPNVLSGCGLQILISCWSGILSVLASPCPWQSA